MAQRPRVEDFNLSHFSEGFSESNSKFTKYLPFIGPTVIDEWAFRRVNQDAYTDPSVSLLDWAYNAQKKTLVVFSAVLVSESEDDKSDNIRLTDMYLSDMLADCWLRATETGKSQELRYVGIDTIINERAKAAMQAEWDHQVKTLQPPAGQVPYGPLPDGYIKSNHYSIAITPANSFVSWTDNPFIKAGVRLAASLSTPDKAVVCAKAHIIRRAQRGPTDVPPEGYGPWWDIMLEFQSGSGAPQENFTEEVTRLMRPMVIGNIRAMEAARAADPSCDLDGIQYVPPEFQ